MSRADNTKGLTLASSPTFKKVFGMKNISRASDLPFIIENKEIQFPTMVSNTYGYLRTTD